MKFIGQFIQSLVSRFRNDVFLENISSGTIASGGNLGLDSNNKIVKATETTGDITAVTIVTDNGAVAAASQTSGNATFTLVGSTGVGVTNSSELITVTAVPGEIDHDSLNNFVSAEHVDWAGASAGTIHSSNIPTLNQDTTGSAATLTTERDLQVNLASTSADGFDGGGNADNIGVSGTLAIGNGGTGNTSGNATGLTASTSNSIGVGSIELGHADDTTIARSAAGKITVEGKEVRTADRQIQAVYASFQASDIDMPIVAPFAGKLLSISIRQTRNTSTHNYTLRLETQAAGVTHATGPTVVATQSGSSPSNTSIVTYDFTSGLDNVGESNVINAGDYVYISIESDTAPGGSTKYFFTCLFEWDYSSI